MRFLLLAAALAIATLGSAQVLASRSVSTSGHPTQALWTPDGQYVLVTITREHPISGGIEIFRVDGAKLKRIAYQPLGDDPAQGILLIPHTRTLAVGLSDAGVAFLSLDATLQGKAVAHVIAQGDRPGSSGLAVTPDGATLFVANEYLHGGRIGVIALRHSPRGELAPYTTAQLKTQLGTPAIAISPDGARLYALAQVLPENWPQRLPGSNIPELQHGNCFDGPGSGPRPNGGLFVIDAAKAAALPPNFTPQQEHDAAPRLMNAGCSPVAVTVSSDGRTLYVIARGDNNVLVFDAAALERDPAHAFLRAIDTGGEAPVGLALFDHDRKLLVANSNRFTNSPGNVTVIDLADAANPKITQTIKAGDLPRNITLSPDGRSLLLTVYFDDELMLLTRK